MISCAICFPKSQLQIALAIDIVFPSSVSSFFFVLSLIKNNIYRAIKEGLNAYVFLNQEMLVEILAVPVDQMHNQA